MSSSPSPLLSHDPSPRVCAPTTQTKETKGGTHDGVTYLKGMPSELGGHNVYEPLLKKIVMWLKSPIFCPTQNAELRALQV